MSYRPQGSSILSVVDLKVTVVTVLDGRLRTDQVKYKYYVYGKKRDFYVKKDFKSILLWIRTRTSFLGEDVL